MFGTEDRLGVKNLNLAVNSKALIPQIAIVRYEFPRS